MSEREKSPLVRALVAAVAVVAVPIVAAGAQTGSIVSSNPTKRSCTVRTTLGTRLGRTVVCQTKEERDQLKREGRDTVERVQNRKVLGSN